MDVYHRGRSAKKGHRLLAQASVVIRLTTIVILNRMASSFAQSKTELKNKQQ